MNSKILLLAISVAAFSSCSTAYKTGQTPDDVYYSPSRSYEFKEEKEERVEDRRDYYSFEDRQIRMGINNPRWRSLDYDLYSYNPYYYGYNNGYYYNPYYYAYPVYNPIHCYPNYVIKPIVKAPVRITNLNTYSNNNYSNTNTRNEKLAAARPANTYNNSNSYKPKPSKNNSGNYSVPDNNSGSNRTYSPSSNNSSSGSGNSGNSGSSGRGSSRPSRN